LSVIVARRKRAALYVSIAGLMFMVAAMSTISARDPDGTTVRIGMVLLVVGAAMWLPWQTLLPSAIAIWLLPNLGRNLVNDYQLFDLNMMLELPALLGLAAVASVARISLSDLEQENLKLGMRAETVGVDPVTGVFEETQLRPSIETELSRSRRFGRGFALVLIGIDEMRQRFDYRDEEIWQASFAATAELLRGTRNNVDRVYRYGPAGFALILPESGPKEVTGLVHRLRRVARKAKPAESEPGGPLPAHYGATFYPTCATATDDLMRRAGIALRIADNNASRMQLDGAEAPEMPPVETLRQPELPEVVAMPAVESGGSVSPVLRVLEPSTAQIEPYSETAGTSASEEALPNKPEPILTSAQDELTVDSTTAEPATPQPLFATSTQEETQVQAGSKAKESSRAEVFAYRAPEPAVGVYNESWETEAPLSVIRRPKPAPRLVAVGGDTSRPQESVDEVISNALKQLDDTLELIRSLKQRSA
jgi:diguanylate cyclase (GGDEF)-like protein